MGYWFERISAVLILAAIAIFSFIVILIPLSHNSLQSGDIPGHLAAATYIRDTLWPSPIGWDQRFFAGYPLNQFYSPLLSWVVATVGFIMPIDLAFKLILMLSILATPISVYYCARKYAFRPLTAAVCALAVFAALFAVYPRWMGSEFFSVFIVGLVINCVAFPLLFFYMGRLKGDMSKGTYVIATLLLALVSLSHVILGLCAWIFAISYLLTSGRSHWRRILAHLGISFLLIAFWVLPFLAKIKFSDPQSGAVLFITLTGTDALLLSIAIIGIIYLVVFKKDDDVMPLVAFFTLLMIVFFVNMVAHIPVQLFRIYFIAFSVSFFFAIKALAARNRWLLLLPIIVALVVIANNFGAMNFNGPEKITIPPFGHVDGRIMTLFFPPSWHSVNTEVAQNTDNLLERGLFSESALNSEFYLNAENIIPYAIGINQSNKYRIFGTNWILNDNIYNQSYTESRYITTYRNMNIFLYRVGNSSLAETLTYIPQTVSGDWKDLAKYWYNGNYDRIEVLSDQTLPSVTGTGNEQVDVLQADNERIRLHVDTTTPVPVFLKFSFFPNWHAYVNGKPVQIYRVLPSFMLVYGYDDIELRYEQLPIDIIAWSLSVLGIVCLLMVAIIPRLALQRPAIKTPTPKPSVKHEKPPAPFNILDWIRSDSGRVVTISVLSRVLVFILALTALWFLPKFAAFGSCGNGTTGTPDMFDMWVRWDARSYLSMAQYGPIFTPGGPSNTAYFPLYPLLIRLLSFLVNPTIAGVIISNLALVGAGYVLYKLLRLDVDNQTALNAVLYTVLFGSSLFFSAVYTESLFLLLSVGAFYCARKQKWVWAGVLGALATITRIPGIILFPALVIEYCLQNNVVEHWRLRIERIRPAVLWTLLSPLALSVYMLFLKWSVGDALAFVKSQAANNALQYPYSQLISQFLHPTPLGIFGMPFLTFIIVMIVLMWRRVRPSYTIYTVLSVLTVLSFAGTLSSDRYLLALFPIFLALAMITARRRTLHNVLISGFVVLMIIMTWLFVNCWYPA